jgi:hypothetical protein
MMNVLSVANKWVDTVGVPEDYSNCTNQANAWVLLVRCLLESLLHKRVEYSYGWYRCTERI